MGKKLERFVDEEEWCGGRRKGLRTRSSADGVLIQPQRRRMLGVHQVRAMADALLRAASHAEKRGAPSHLVGG